MINIFLMDDLTNLVMVCHASDPVPK